MRRPIRTSWTATSTTSTAPITTPFAFASQARSTIEKKKYAAKASAIAGMTRSAPKDAFAFTWLFFLCGEEPLIFVGELDHGVRVLGAGGAVAVLDGLDGGAGLGVLFAVL